MTPSARPVMPFDAHLHLVAGVALYVALTDPRSDPWPIAVGAYPHCTHREHLRWHDGRWDVSMRPHRHDGARP